MKQSIPNSPLPRVEIIVVWHALHAAAVELRSHALLPTVHQLTGWGPIGWAQNVALAGCQLHKMREAM